MSKRNKLIIIGAAVLVVIIALSVGLGVGLSNRNKEPQNTYNAVVYDRSVDWLSWDFVADNMTRNATYVPPEILGDPFGEPRFDGDETSPDKIIHVITERERFEEVFNEFPVEVDFSKEMIVVYLFTDIYNGFACEFKSIELKDGNLDITVLHKMPPPMKPATSQPWLRCVTIKLDKVEVENVNVGYIDEKRAVDWRREISLILDNYPWIILLAVLLIVAVVVSIVIIVKHKKRRKISNNQ